MFPMARAEYLKEFEIPGFEDIQAGIIKWPLSVIRLRSKDRHRITLLADNILAKWRDYTDEDAFIYAETDSEKHNTITPIARMNGDLYEFDLTLRNNITTKECPLGLYHPHDRLHHIKKENIGLIEVMGLAILPSRLKSEIALLKDYILNGKDINSNEEIRKHAEWVEEFKSKYDRIDESNIDGIMKDEIGLVFMQVLEDAGVYKQTDEGIEAFLRFVKKI